ncbi:MAG TPA: alpha/beta hydrolase [bacterium]|nr:alpha/beta hydrolase [bacterium]
MKRFILNKRHWMIRFGLAALALGLIVSWVEGGRLCASTNHPVALPKDLAVQPVTFSSASGANISGWIAEGATNRGVVILQHGVRSDKSTMVARAKFLTQAGYAVLMFDFQAHGESPGEKITFGYLESRDSEAAVEFAKNRFPNKPVGIIGISLGAAATVLANPPLDVQALVLEMMYPTIEEATKDRIEMRLGSPGRLLSPLLTTQIPLRAGCKPEELRPIIQVAKISVPKLFLAGTADQDTKFSESQAIFAAAAEPKQFLPFEGARHQDLHDFAPTQYEKAVLEFLDAHLK